MGLHETYRMSIYESHLDEASFLYEQRQRFLDDPEVTLDDVEELELRHEAHLDGLFLGGDLAARMCVEQLQKDDAGVIHSSLRVLFRRASDPEVVWQHLSALSDHEDPEVQSAVAAALCLDFSSGWASYISPALARAGAGEVALLSQLVGYHVWTPYAEAVSDAAQRIAAGSPAAALSSVWALGELRERSAQRWLADLARTAQRDVAIAATIALAKCGVLPTVSLFAADSSWAALALAVTGQADVRKLERFLSATTVDAADVLIALAICGDPGGLPTLMAALANEKLARCAAVGLHLLTGVVMLQEVVVPPLSDETLDEDLATPEPDEEARGVPPVRPTTRKQLSQDAAAWQQVIDAWRARGVPRGLVRMGCALSTESTCAALQSSALPLRVRSFLADELQVQRPGRAPYRTQALVKQQRSMLASIASEQRTENRRAHG